MTSRASAASRRLDRTLSALADPTRRGVIELLRERPRRAGELADAFRASAPAMSRHLRVLRMRGLVEEERVDDDARVRVYRLRREPFDALQVWLRERPRRAGELAAAFDASAPAMSRHLRVLRTRGLVVEERVDGDARVRVYRLRREPFDALQLWLRELESFWGDQLDSFGAHVARRRAAGQRNPR